MKKTSKTIQWIFTAIFGISALANGFHISTFLLLLATLLLMPIEPIRNFLKDKIKIKSGLIERWIKKINALNQKKSTYEDILRQRLDNLDKDYALLKMQAQELIVRNNKSQIQMPLAA